MGFLGGSAYAMARDISEGYILFNPSIMKRTTPAELQQLKFELEKTIRDARANQPPVEDTIAQQQRNRKILRIQQAIMMIENQLKQRKYPR